jgi:hypothetical protein
MSGDQDLPGVEFDSHREKSGRRPDTSRAEDGERTGIELTSRRKCAMVRMLSDTIGGVGSYVVERRPYIACYISQALYG